MPANKSEPKKTMDVSKPGKSAPNTSARPILVSHTPQVQDPMMKPEASDLSAVTDGAADPKTEAPSSGHKVIQPLTGAEPTDEEKAKASEAQSSTSASEDSAVETEEAKEAAVVDAVAEQTGNNKKTGAEPTEEELKKTAEIEKLVTGKKYFVPIGQVSKRRNRRTVIVLLVLVLALAGLYGAVDAGVLDIGVKVPYSFIQN